MHVANSNCANSILILILFLPQCLHVCDPYWIILNVGTNNNEGIHRFGYACRFLCRCVVREVVCVYDESLSRKRSFLYPWNGTMEIV